MSSIEYRKYTVYTAKGRQQRYTHTQERMVRTVQFDTKLSAQTNLQNPFVSYHLYGAPQLTTIFSAIVIRARQIEVILPIRGYILLRFETSVLVVGKMLEDCHRHQKCINCW